MIAGNMYQISADYQLRETIDNLIYLLLFSLWIGLVPLLLDMIARSFLGIGFGIAKMVLFTSLYFGGGDLFPVCPGSTPCGSGIAMVAYKCNDFDDRVLICHPCDVVSGVLATPTWVA